MRKLVLISVMSAMLLTLLTISGAFAGNGTATLSGPLFSIQATTASGLLGSVDIPNPWGPNLVDTASWVLDHDINITAGDIVIGKLTAFQYSIASAADPTAMLIFAVQAGSSDTTFNFSSGPVSFSTITNGMAYASAGVTLTGDSNGATITGLFGGKCYQARYNASNTVFTNLVNSFSTPVDSTSTASERNPVAGRVQIAGAVDSIQSQFNFTLSANDTASGTSRFDIIPIPEPGSLLALGGGLIGLIGFNVRRKR